MYYFALLLNLIIGLYTLYVIYKHYIKKEDFWGEEYFILAFAWIPMKDKVTSALIVSNTIAFLFLLGAPVSGSGSDEINQYMNQANQTMQELNQVDNYLNQ